VLKSVEESGHVGWWSIIYTVYVDIAYSAVTLFWLGRASGP